MCKTFLVLFQITPLGIKFFHSMHWPLLSLSSWLIEYLYKVEPGLEPHRDLESITLLVSRLCSLRANGCDFSAANRTLLYEQLTCVHVESDRKSFSAQGCVWDGVGAAGCSLFHLGALSVCGTNSFTKRSNVLMSTISLEFWTLLKFRVLLKLETGLSLPAEFPNEALRRFLQYVAGVFFFLQ